MKIRFRQKAAKEVENLHHNMRRFNPYYGYNRLDILCGFHKMYCSIYSGHRSRARKQYDQFTDCGIVVPTWVVSYFNPNLNN